MKMKMKMEYKYPYRRKKEIIFLSKIKNKQTNITYTIIEHNWLKKKRKKRRNEWKNDESKSWMEKNTLDN